MINRILYRKSLLVTTLVYAVCSILTIIHISAQQQRKPNKQTFQQTF